MRPWIKKQIKHQNFWFRNNDKFFKSSYSLRNKSKQQQREGGGGEGAFQAVTSKASLCGQNSGGNIGKRRIVMWMLGLHQKINDSPPRRGRSEFRLSKLLLPNRHKSTQHLLATSLSEGSCYKVDVGDFWSMNIRILLHLFLLFLLHCHRPYHLFLKKQ